jgi:hypothetical protein
VIKPQEIVKKGEIMDQDFLNGFISKPLTEIPTERLERIQRWLMIVYKKMEFGLSKGIEESGMAPLTRTQIQTITSEIWKCAFRVPVFELIDEEEIATQLLTQKIRPMTTDDIFNLLNKSDLTEN